VFKVGDYITHVRDPFKEKHEVIDLVNADFGDGCGRMIIKSETTGEQMPIIISRVGLAGWKKT